MEEVCAGDTEAISDAEWAGEGQAQRPQRHNAEAKADHSPIPSMAAGQTTRTEKAAEYADDETVRDCEASPVGRSPPLATIIAAVRITERCATV